MKKHLPPSLRESTVATKGREDEGSRWDNVQKDSSPMDQQVQGLGMEEVPVNSPVFI